jgi:hypothetical protein
LQWPNEAQERPSGSTYLIWQFKNASFCLIICWSIDILYSVFAFLLFKVSSFLSIEFSPCASASYFLLSVCRMYHIIATSSFNFLLLVYASMYVVMG